MIITTQKQRMTMKTEKVKCEVLMCTKLLKTEHR